MMKKTHKLLEGQRIKAKANGGFGVIRGGDAHGVEGFGIGLFGKSGGGGGLAKLAREFDGIQSGGIGARAATPQPIDVGQIAPDAGEAVGSHLGVRAQLGETRVGNPAGDDREGQKNQERWGTHRGKAEGRITRGEKKRRGLRAGGGGSCEGSGGF